MPKPATQSWLDKAKEDEAVLALIQTNGEPWSLAGYHAQQAAEKYVKAALAEAGVVPPKTHEAPRLLALHQAGLSVTVMGRPPD